MKFPAFARSFDTGEDEGTTAPIPHVSEAPGAGDRMRRAGDLRVHDFASMLRKHRAAAFRHAQEELGDGGVIELVRIRGCCTPLAMALGVAEVRASEGVNVPFAPTLFVRGDVARRRWQLALPLLVTPLMLGQQMNIERWIADVAWQAAHAIHACGA